MNEHEVIEKIAHLKKKKSALERNRNICILLIAFLGYSAWTTTQQKPPPTWFYFAIGSIMLGLAIIAHIGHSAAKATHKPLTNLQNDLDKKQNQHNTKDDKDLK